MYKYLKTDLNRELSKLLYERGCVSDIGYSWIDHTDSLGQHFIELRKDTAVDYLSDEFICTAYTLEDILQRENAIKIWEEEIVPAGYSNGKSFEEQENRVRKVYVAAWQQYTYRLINLYQLGYDWQQYIIDHLTVTTPPHL